MTSHTPAAARLPRPEFLSRNRHALMAALIVILAWSQPLQLSLRGFDWSRGGGVVVHELPSNWAAVEHAALMLLVIGTAGWAVLITAVIVVAAVRKRVPAATRTAVLRLAVNAGWSLTVLVTVMVIRNVLEMTP